MSSIYLPDDVVRNIALFLSDREVCNVIQVCKPWNLALENDAFWSLLISTKGLPRVEGINEGFKEVYRNLSSRTFGGAIFKECFGEVRGIPPLSKERYKMLIEQYDSFIPEGFPKKKMSRTFYLMILPSHVYHRHEEKLYNLFIASQLNEDKAELSADRTEIKIPFTPNNCKLLMEYLHPDCKVFDFVDTESEEVERTPLSDKTTLWLMRDEVVFCNDSYAYQKQLIRERGFQLIPLIVRVAFNAMKIRKTGTCPDTEGMYARTFDAIRWDNDSFPLAIGNFTLEKGIRVTGYVNNASPNCGAVAGIPAEVQ